MKVTELNYTSLSLNSGSANKRTWHQTSFHYLLPWHHMVNSCKYQIDHFKHETTYTLLANAGQTGQ